ncbi:SYF1 [Candida margitis]|uniref:SYF1 n=1 Tax=Candida margitis TaxID=1775924 RepID=UPI002226AA83|nr:SYF1 [Candida margitis]KAI5952181.1 SYF1 [Candida margitis]
MISVDEVLKDEDLHYEVALAKNEKDLNTWETYYSTKLNDALPAKLSLISRAVKALSNSEDLWINYLNLVDTNYELMSIQDIKLIFDQCLTTQSKSITIWLKILEILIDHAIDQVTYVRHKFNQCLQNVPVQDHSKVWVLFIKFGDIIEGPTGIEVYSRLMKFASPEVLNGSQVGEKEELNLTILDFIDKFVELGGDDTHVLKLYSDIVHSNGYSNLPKSQVSILFEYLDLLIKNSAKDKEFELEINKAIQKYPDQTTNLQMKFIDFYKSKKGNFANKIRSIYQQAVKDCKTVYDFEKAYNGFTKFEENDIESYLDTKSSPDTTILSQKLTAFEKLLNDRQLLINDLQLRQDINNVDYWFDRFGIFQNQLNVVIQTIANAIKSINPLKIPRNCHHKLYEIWIKYAQIYASSSDFKTADFIYGKSIQSQYPHPNELAELYINWSEMRLSHDYFQESDAIELLEDVLYRESANDVDINYSDSSIPVQKRIRKSIQLWDFYLDLVESFIESANDTIYIDKVCQAYETLIKLKIATPKKIMAYAQFLETWGYIEKSLSVYERCLDIFKDEAIRLEIWRIYITKLKYIDHKERRKDIEERYREVVKYRGK